MIGFIVGAIFGGISGSVTGGIGWIIFGAIIGGIMGFGISAKQDNEERHKKEVEKLLNDIKKNND